MFGENHGDDVLEAWQSQATESFQMTEPEIRRRIELMDKKSRRHTYDLYAALTLTSVVIVVIAAIAPNLIQTMGAVLTVVGFACLSYEVHKHRRRAPSAETGELASIGFHRAQLQHHLDFCRTRLWYRVLCVAPGGVLFFAGFALAHPKLASMIYFQLVTFVIVIIAMFPLNRRMAAKVQRQIDELDHLGDRR